MAVVLGAVGCAQPMYHAASLPPQMQAPLRHNTMQVDLSRFTEPGGNSGRIYAGDRLAVEISTGLEENGPISIRVQVAEDGGGIIPLVGPVQFAGLTFEGAAAAIRQASIERGVYIDPQISVRVDQRATYRVTVLGAVEEPQTYEIPAYACNLVTAIGAAGGLTPEAETVVEIRHPNPASSTPPGGEIRPASFEQDRPSEMRVDLASPRSEEQNLQLHDGSVVVVPRKTPHTVSVMGVVDNQGQYDVPLGDDLYLMDAIAMAGGPRTWVADKVTILRRNPEGGDPIRISASIREAKSGGPGNLRLAPGDLVTVDETPATVALDTFQSFFRIGLSAALPIF